MYGKVKENRKAGQKFSEWVQEMFPGLHQDAAADAMWLATLDDALYRDSPPDITHPKNIRQWHRDHQATQALPEDL